MTPICALAVPQSTLTVTLGLPSPGTDEEPTLKTPVSWIYQEGGTTDVYLHGLLLWTFSPFGGRLHHLRFQGHGALWLTGWPCPSPDFTDFSWHFKSAHALLLEHSRILQEKKTRDTQGLQETLKLRIFK